LVGRRFVLGLVSLPIPGSLFSTALLFLFAYWSQLVNTIGDTRQLGPLFLGIVAGSILFSFAGYLTRSTWLTISLETIVALLLLVSSYVVMAANSLVLGGTLILVISFAMTSVSAPVGTMLRFRRQNYSVPARVMFGATQAVLSILFVLVFSIYYETTGQINFFIGPLILLVLSLVSFLILLRVR
jgi:hypothetical protein